MDLCGEDDATVIVRRGTFSIPLVALVVFSISLSSSFGAPAPLDWPQFLGPTRNGVYTGSINTHWPAGGPPKLWSKSVGQGFAGPAVSGGRLFLFHRVADKERLECMEPMTGKTIWSGDYPTHYQDAFGFDEGPRATPAVDGKRVYTFGAQGVLGCWDVDSGNKTWSVDVQAKYASEGGFFGMACSPLIEGNAVILNIGGAKGAGVVAFDKTNGNVLWKATDDEASYSSPTAATIAGQRYVLVFTRAALVGLGPGDGKILFQFPWRARIRESVNAATPLVIDDLVFISASYQTGAALLRIGASGVTKVWSGDNILSNHYATSVYHDGMLYGFDGRQEYGPSLRCVELKTGKVRWTQESFGAGSILMADKYLLIMGEKGQLICAPATPDGFKPIAQAQVMPFEIRAYPALAEGLMFVRSKDKLVCLDLRPAH